MNSRLTRLTLALFSAGAVAASADSPALLPQPASIESHDGCFVARPETRLLADSRALAAARLLAGHLRQSTGLPLPLRRSDAPHAIPGAILITSQASDPSLGPEGYTLTVTPDSVVVRAPNDSGLFYGVQSLLQLFPAKVFAPRVVRGLEWKAPCVTIRDLPRFPWRGLMLDVSRHFFSKAEIEQLLDLMALLKLNTFHWHLTDNDGWRLEIKKYPRLTQIGAWRDGIGYGFDSRDRSAYGADGRYGGYYTQADIRAIVRYAQARQIIIVPEIELPGHSRAALQAYPQLNCQGGNGSPAAPLGVYCPGNEAAFTFLQDVLSEVFELFPGRYVHIGGDEVDKRNWKQCPLCAERIKKENLGDEQALQGYFIKRIQQFVQANHRTLIGWTEIRQGRLAPGAVLMDWKGGAAESAREGHDVVMTPNLDCYFNSYQWLDYSVEPIAIGCYISLERAYAFEPVPAGLEPQFQPRILGAQASLWTEYIASRESLQYMLFPRLCALAEVVWSPKDSRNWDDFSRRLTVQCRRLDELGVRYRRSTSVKLGAWTPSQVSTGGVTLEWDVTSLLSRPDKQYLILDDALRPSTSGLLSEPGKCHIVFEHTGGDVLKIAWVSLLENGQEIARDVHPGLAGAEPRDLVARNVAYILSASACKTGCRYSIRACVVAPDSTNSWGNVYFDARTTK